MNSIETDTSQKQIYYRLITLWVICEAFAGGIMHGIKIPFSGLVISSLAMICIILIAYHVPEKNAILKATIIVAIFKLMLSPHSPGPAYIAVFFQGLLGNFLFGNKKYFTASAIILGILGAVESAIQRLLVLVIVYGNAFWKAFNVYINKLTGEKSITNYTLFIAIGYIFIHAIVGLLVGIYASRMAKRSLHWKVQHPEFLIKHTEEHQNNFPKKKKKIKAAKWIFVICWALLLSAYVHSWIVPGNAIIPKNEIMAMLLRSVLIITTWLFFLSPLLSLLIKKSIENKKVKHHEAIAVITKLLPESKSIFISCWKFSAKEKGVARLKLFTKMLIINTI